MCYFQGIQYLVDNELLEWKPEAVAEFLYKEEGLNKTAIGNFLGERYDDGDIFVANTACGSDIEKKDVSFLYPQGGDPPSDLAGFCSPS